MAASDARVQTRFARAGLAAIPPVLGLHLLAAVLAAGSAQAVAAPIQWRQLLRQGRQAPRIFAAFAQPRAAAVTEAAAMAAAPSQVCMLAGTAQSGKGGIDAALSSSECS
jgi:hypothetical protein